MQAAYTLAHLSDAELLDGLRKTVARCNEAIALVLAHLAEVDRRKLYLSRAKPSLFQYAVDVLNMGESEAYVRIYAARAARDYPVIFDMVASNRLHLTAIKLVTPHLTAANHRELLDAVSNKSKCEIQLVLARRFPQPDVAQTIRKLPQPRGQTAPAADVPLLASATEQSRPSEPTSAPTAATLPTAPTARRRQQAPASTEPLSARRYKVQFTVSAEVHGKLRAAQDLLRHQVPSGDLNAVFERALDALLAQKLKNKYATSPREQPDKANAKLADHRRAPRTRHIPNAIKRAVLARDGQRCTYVDDAGNRCTETGGLELHHVVPFAKGGAHTVDNIRVACRAHNAHAAELDYGVAWLESRRRRRTSPRGTEVRSPHAIYRAAG